MHGVVCNVLLIICDCINLILTESHYNMTVYRTFLKTIKTNNENHTGVCRGLTVC